MPSTLNRARKPQLPRGGHYGRLMRSTALLPTTLAFFGSSAFGQAVNLGGAGNTIIPDGRTGTTLATVGRTTTINTSTYSGGNAYNSFSQFKEGPGNTVNLNVPNNANYLVNIVRDGPVNIQGTLNSYKSGKLGGNVVFSDSYGFVVGSQGVVNTGSLTVITPAQGVNDAVLGANGKINNALAGQLIRGNVPLSADGSVIIQGRVNAQHGVTITAHDVMVAGSYGEAVKSARHRAMFESTVNASGMVEGAAIVSRNGSIRIVAAGNIDIAGAVRAGRTAAAGSTGTGATTRVAKAGTRPRATPRTPAWTGSVSFAAAGDLDIEKTAVVAASGGGGSLNPSVALSAGGAATIAGSISVSAASGAAPGRISVTSGGDTSVAGTAVFKAVGTGGSNGGAVKIYADGDLAVAGGAAFNVAAKGTGDGGAVELSARNNATIGAIVLDASAVSGKYGSLLEDPTTLVITGGTTGTYGATDTNQESNGAAITLSATQSITLASDGVVDSTQTFNPSVGGAITLISPSITVLGGGKINAGSGATAGNILLESYDPAKAQTDASLNSAPQTASIAIGDGGIAPATITGGNIALFATAQLPATANVSLTPLPATANVALTPAATTSAAVSFDNATVTAAGTLTATASATGIASSTGAASNAFVANVFQTVKASTTVSGTSVLASSGDITLASQVIATSTAMSAPDATYGTSAGAGNAPADAAGAISILTTSAITAVGQTTADAPVVQSTGGNIAITASNQSTSTASADATKAAFAGVSFAVNGLSTTTQASIGGAALVMAQPALVSGITLPVALPPVSLAPPTSQAISVLASSQSVATTTALASAQGAPSTFPMSSALQPYIAQGTDVATAGTQFEPKFGQYLSSIEGSTGGVAGSAVVALAGLSSLTSATINSSNPSATTANNGLVTVASQANNSSVTTADGSNVATPTEGTLAAIGAAVAINVGVVSNLATVGSGVSSNGLDVLANMTGATAPQIGTVAPLGAGPDADAADNAFSALATSGAGGSQVGVSGALAVNALDSKAIAQVSPGVSLALSDGAVVIQSNDLSTATAIAMPATATAGSPNGQLGVGASIALNLVSTTSTAALSDGVNLPAPGSLTLDAEATHAVVTQAAAGAAGGIAVTPVVAISLIADQTSATIGALTTPITTNGAVSVTAAQWATALTTGSGAVAGGKAAVGATLATAIIDDSVVATTGTTIIAAGDVTFSAKGASLSVVSAVASPSGAGDGTDPSSGQATDSDGNVATKLALLVNDAGALGATAGTAIDQTQKNNTMNAGNQARPATATWPSRRRSPSTPPPRPCRPTSRRPCRSPRPAAR